MPDEREKSRDRQHAKFMIFAHCVIGVGFSVLLGVYNGVTHHGLARTLGWIAPTCLIASNLICVYQRVRWLRRDPQPPGW